MLRKTLLLIASLAPAIAIMPGARADICFEYGTGGGTSVAKGAKVPPVNTCIRVTPVDLGARLGVATGSICQVFPQTGSPMIVFQYTYDACTGPGSWFESATCRIRLSDTGDLPSERDPGQSSSCNGIYAAPDTNKTSPVTQFSDISLRVWDCTNSNLSVPTGSPGQCIGSPPMSRSHPPLPLGGMITPTPR